MPRFKDAPVFDIDEKKLEEIKMANVPPKPKVEKKYKPGSIYATQNYPGYEGINVFLGISDSHKGQNAMVRVTGVLPALPAKSESTASACPSCGKNFPHGYLFLPGIAGIPEQEFDQTYTESDFDKKLSEWKAVLHSGG